LTLLRSIKANPLRPKIVGPRSSGGLSSFLSGYRVHGLDEADEVLNPLSVYERLSLYAAVRQRVWQGKVRLPIVEQNLAVIRRSSATGLPYTDENWVQDLAKELNRQRTIRPRG
jgi:hypothetical protein